MGLPIAMSKWGKYKMFYKSVGAMETDLKTFIDLNTWIDIKTWIDLKTWMI